MTISKGDNLGWLLDESHPSDDELAWDHAMDISGSVYTRMKELGMTQAELAERMGMDPGRLSRIIHGAPNLTLKTIAKLENALEFDLSSGFKYYRNNRSDLIELGVAPVTVDHEDAPGGWNVIWNSYIGAMGTIKGGLAA